MKWMNIVSEHNKELSVFKANIFSNKSPKVAGKSTK